MATKVMMEALSPTMEEGRLVKWLKNEGDAVKTGDTLAEVETDKAIMELVARGDGVLRARLLNEGDGAPIGQLIGVIAAPDEDIAALTGGAGGSQAGGQSGAQAAPTASSPSPAPGSGAGAMPAQQLEPPRGTALPPQQSEADASVPAHQHAANAGRPPEMEELTDRAAAPVAVPPAAHAPRTAMPQSGQHESEQAHHAADTGGRVLSSPLARRMASERGLELDGIRGSGPNGRIIRKDVEAAASGARPAAAPAAVAAPAVEAPAAPAPATAPAAPAAPATGDATDVPLTNIRKTIARRLSESIGPIPTFYLTAEFDMEKAAELRTQLAAMGDEYKASYNDIVLKATAVALTMHPECNAHWLGDRIRTFSRVHLGMAVAIEEGLITPVIFDADHKRLGQISKEARSLAGRARERKLRPEEFTGSTFSVSNLGMFGIDQFTAIINPPEAGILAVGAIEEKPVVVDGAVQVRKRMRVTMSCDHRIIDGALGAKFLQTLRRLVENPLMLL
jgi:pyruvate dehydrogenase E2 component (dihydrolipoamide acetyltransferase)